MILCGISIPLGMLSPARRQVSHALLTRSPLYSRINSLSRSTCMPNPRRQRSFWARIELSVVKNCIWIHCRSSVHIDVHSKPFGSKRSRRALTFVRFVAHYFFFKERISLYGNIFPENQYIRVVGPCQPVFENQVTYFFTLESRQAPPVLRTLAWYNSLVPVCQ